MSHIPLVSVIMPMYNVAPYVDTAIQSILQQTWESLELIIIDDGSTDNSLQIALKATHGDPRVQIFTQHNQGQGQARNRGMQLAQGKYIYLFDSDDLLDRDALSACVSSAETNQADLIAFSGTSFSSTDIPQPDSNPYQKPDIEQPISGAELFYRLSVTHQYSAQPCMYFFARQLTLQEGLRFDESVIHEDEGFIPLLLCHAQRSICMAKRYYRHRLRQGSTMAETQNASERNIAGYFAAAVKLANFRQRHKNSLPKPARSALLKRQRLLLHIALGIAERIGASDNHRSRLKKLFDCIGLLELGPALLLHIFVPALSHPIKKLRPPHSPA